MSELNRTLQIDMIDEVVDLLTIKGVTECTAEVVDDFLENQLKGEVFAGFLLGKYRTFDIKINTPPSDLKDDEVLQIIVDRFNKKG